MLDQTDDFVVAPDRVRSTESSSSNGQSGSSLPSPHQWLTHGDLTDRPQDVGVIGL